MSFIFEALRKSEEQRQRSCAPELRLVYPAPPPSAKGWRLATGMLFAALVLNASILLWWLRPWQEPIGSVADPSPGQVGMTVSAEGAADAESAPEPEKEIIRAAKAPSRPIPPPPGWLEFSRPAATTAPEEPGKDKGGRGGGEAATADLAEIPFLQELPPDSRRGVPEITISLHYYAAEPKSRLVRLNGRILRQGEGAGNGLLLEEITPTGVVLRLGEVRFRMGNF